MGHTQVLDLSSGQQKRTDHGLDWRRPQWKMTSMEDDLKNLKLDFDNNYWRDHKHILNSSSGDQKEIDKGLNYRWTLNENGNENEIKDNLKDEFIRNYWINHNQILKDHVD